MCESNRVFWHRIFLLRLNSLLPFKCFLGKSNWRSLELRLGWKSLRLPTVYQLWCFQERWKPLKLTFEPAISFCGPNSFSLLFALAQNSCVMFVVVQTKFNFSHPYHQCNRCHLMKMFEKRSHTQVLQQVKPKITCDKKSATQYLITFFRYFNL